MQDLPTGISEFSELRQRKCLYVDKTKYVYGLLTKDTRTFLSRPRRFGKSLLVSTLAAALQGEKELFEGLWIADSDYSFQPYGVIRLDFSSFSVANLKEFKESLLDSLTTIGSHYGIEAKESSNVNIVLKHLVNQLKARYQSVAILIDEYDYPILHTLHNPRLAKEIRDLLRSFSTAIKACSPSVRFVFITGVSAFSKSGLSSGLNNLTNLTMMREFSGICGYTEEEIHSYFSEHIKGLAQAQKISFEEAKKQLKDWYNGYCFHQDSDGVYSPFSFISALRAQGVQNFWFESATVEVLLEEIAKAERSQCFSCAEEFYGTMDFLQTFEIEDLPLTALLFQRGYLTIDSYDPDSKMYHLRYPNQEVRIAMNKSNIFQFASSV